MGYYGSDWTDMYWVIDTAWQILRHITKYLSSVTMNSAIRKLDNRMLSNNQTAPYHFKGALLVYTRSYWSEITTFLSGWGEGVNFDDPPTIILSTQFLILLCPQWDIMLWPCPSVRASVQSFDTSQTVTYGDERWLMSSIFFYNFEFQFIFWGCMNLVPG